jgi:hypothetical protein
MVCMHVFTGKQTRRGLYFEGDKLLWGTVEEWKMFWGPLEATLIKWLECRSL